MAWSVLAGFCWSLVLLPLTARGNVYATQVQINGGFTNVLGSNAGPVTISYLLNEPANGGVTVRVWSSSSIVRTLNVVPGNGGTLKGSNALVWDGLLNGNLPATPGLYRVSVTASNTGHSAWTQISSDADSRTYVWEGRGVAVNQNQDSPYYGRIFVANAAAGPGSLPGDQVGILKLNADFSYATEGSISTGGHAWAGDLFSPWKVEVSEDGSVYVNDFSSAGGIYRFDPQVSTNSQLQVTDTNNVGDAGRAQLSGFTTVGTGPDTTLWVTDQRSSGTLGVLRFQLGPTGQALSNNTGTVVIGPGVSLTKSPADVALDGKGNIYVVQSVSSALDATPRVLKFPAYDPSTNNGAPLRTAVWAVGQADVNYGNATGVAVDPTGTYLAVSFRGTTAATGNTSVLYTSNGGFVVSMDLGQAISGLTSHQDTDCAWDAAGNLYYLDNFYGAWRAVSPPGPNQSTTLAISAIEVTGPLNILSISLEAGEVNLVFEGAETEAPEAFRLFSSPDPATGYLQETAAVITRISAGKFQATVPITGDLRFYRIKRVPVPFP